jgi:hypothetical protein
MTNPLLKAAGITPYTKNRSAEWALFEAAWKCVCILRYSYDSEGARICCGTMGYKPHEDNCPLLAFDEAFEEFSGGCMNRTEVHRDLEQLINKHSMENGSNTPAFMLAGYLMDALDAFDRACNTRTRWYRKDDREEAV